MQVFCEIVGQFCPTFSHLAAGFSGGLSAVKAVLLSYRKVWSVF
jgi:hypothetical protein